MEDKETTLYVQESFVNATEGYRFGDSEPYESFAKTPGELYRFALREYGRCTGKVYIDPPEGGPPIHVGWTFEKRDKYEDSDETYLREVWVTLHDGPAERTTRYQWHKIG